MTYEVSDSPLQWFTFQKVAPWLYNVRNVRQLLDFAIIAFDGIFLLRKTWQKVKKTKAMAKSRDFFLIINDQNEFNIQRAKLVLCAFAKRSLKPYNLNNTMGNTLCIDWLIKPHCVTFYPMNRNKTFISLWPFFLRLVSPLMWLCWERDIPISSPWRDCSFALTTASQTFKCVMSSSKLVLLL